MEKVTANYDYKVLIGSSKDGKTFWTQIGVGWNKDKKISIKLNAHPIGDMMLIVPNDVEV